MNYTSKIIIIGTNHHNTLSMVRCFGEEGYNVLLYIHGADSSYIASSIYVENTCFFASASSSVDAVISYVKNTTEKPVVIACSDDISSLMDMRYDELIAKCFFFNAGKVGRITYFMDKQKQMNLAKTCGFLTPMSVDALPNDVRYDTITYPCLVKPTASIRGGKNIAICKSKEELKCVLTKYNSLYKILIQEYIRKDYEIVILGMSVKDNIIIPGFIQKHREEKGGTTYATVRPISDLNNSIVDACRRMVKIIGYNGLWGIECIKQGDNYFFIELNMRNDATTYAMKVAGVNLPVLYHKMLHTADNVHPHLQIVKSINSIVEFNDFNFVLKRKIGLLKWLREYKKAQCKYFYSVVDPVPFKLRKREYISFLRKRIFRF